MRKFIYLFAIIIASFSSVKAQYITAEDDASNYSTWTNGSNEGIGFGQWDLTDNNNNSSTLFSGYYIGIDPTQNGRQNISTADDKVFGIYANSSSGTAFAVAKRLFVNSQGQTRALSIDETFSFNLAFSWTGGKRGINLYGGDGSTWLFNIEHTGSDVLSATDGNLANNIFNKNVRIEIEWKGGVTDNIDIHVTIDATTNSFTRTISSSPVGFAFYAERNGQGDNTNYEPFFNSLKIEASSLDGVCSSCDVKINGTVTIQSDEYLTLNDLVIDGSNTLTIKSNADGTGSLIINGSFSGNVIVERYLTNYMDAADAKYHFISSPVTTQKIQDVMDGEVVEVENFVTDPPTAGVDFYKFDETTNTWINSKTSVGAWNNDFEANFVVGRGYLVAYPTAPVTKEFSGTLNNNASYTLTCTYTDGEGNGWNLLGNPYPAAIDWDEVTLGDGMDNALYYYSANSQNYIAYLRIDGDNSTSTGGSQYIPSGQGFMVHAKSSGTRTVTIEKADLTHTGQNNYYKSSTNLLAGSLNLQITGNSFSDQTIIHFNEQATTDFDGNYDAFKLMSANMEVPMIYTSNDAGVLFSINGLPKIEEGTSIPVSVRIGHDDIYTIQGNMNEIDGNVFLEDIKTGVYTKLNEVSSYSFTASADDAPNRFLLHFGIVGLDESPTQTVAHAYVYNSMLYVLNASGQTQVDIIDLQGRTLQSSSFRAEGLYSETISLPTGVYVVRVMDEKGVRTAKVVVE